MTCIACSTRIFKFCAILSIYVTALKIESKELHRARHRKIVAVIRIFHLSCHPCRLYGKCKKICSFSCQSTISLFHLRAIMKNKWKLKMMLTKKSIPPSKTWENLFESSERSVPTDLFKLSSISLIFTRVRWIHFTIEGIFRLQNGKRVNNDNEAQRKYGVHTEPFEFRIFVA